MPSKMTFLVRVELHGETPVSVAQTAALAQELSDSARVWLNFFTANPTAARVEVHPFWTPEHADAIVRTFTGT
jgi:hypothetical protein